ncbi:MAG: diguanylate cyclase [Betaproteobacteria bacterium HGW-Betaproteobacteria-7]|nr:MAG: diguanylate cyclase [Betaproteobacteria bacterium HGW-Betaproteobacteria-7]
MTPALTIAFSYAAFAALWILLSDRAVGWLFTDPAIIVLASTVKGWLFVFVTACLLYWVIRRRTPDVVALPAITGGHLRTLVGLLVVTIIALTTFGALRTFGHHHDMEVERLQTIAELKSQQIANWLLERHSDAELLHGSPSIARQYQLWRDQGEVANGGQLPVILEQFRQRSKTDALLLLDHQGKLLWNSGNTAGLTGALQLAVRQAAADGQIRQVAPDVDSLGHLHLDLVVPLPGVGEPPPLIVLRSDPASWLDPLLASWPVHSQTAESLLFRQEGEEIVFINEVRHRQESAGKLRLPLTSKDLLAARSSRGESRLGEAVSGIDYRDATVIGVVQAIPGSDWFLLAKIDLAELHASTVSEAGWIVLSGLFALFATLVGAVVVRQRQQLLLAEAIGKSQDERLQALTLLGTIADASGDAIFAKDRDGRYLLFNRAAEHLSGKVAEEVIGHDDHVLFPPAQAALVMTNDRDVMQRRSLVTFEEHVQTENGERLFLSTKGPLRDADGQITGLFGISRDITERDRAAEVLRQSEQRFQDIVTASSDWIWEADGEWCYTYVSDSVAKLLGYSADELLGKTLFELMPAEEAGRIRSFLSYTAERQLPIRNLETIILSRDGSLCQVLTSATPIIDSPGQLRGYRGLNHDITDKKFTELFLRQQAEELGQRNQELERFNQAMVGREIDMIELKKAVNALSRELGRAPPHRLDFLEGETLPAEDQR